MLIRLAGLVYIGLVKLVYAFFFNLLLLSGFVLGRLLGEQPATKLREIQKETKDIRDKILNM